MGRSCELRLVLRHRLPHSTPRPHPLGGPQPPSSRPACAHRLCSLLCRPRGLHEGQLSGPLDLSALGCLQGGVPASRVTAAPGSRLVLGVVVVSHLPADVLVVTEVPGLPAGVLRTHSCSRAAAGSESQCGEEEEVPRACLGGRRAGVRSGQGAGLGPFRVQGSLVFMYCLRGPQGRVVGAEGQVHVGSRL